MDPRFAEALQLAAELHRTQVRKSTSIPYIGHLLIVAGLVIEAGGDEDSAIGALLHDAVEDQGGAATLAIIRSRFGDRVAEIVEACSDTDVVPKPPWRARKEAYIAAIAHKSADACLVSLADKVHNAKASLDDHHQIGDRVWERFSGGREGTLWYYRALADAFRPRGHAGLAGIDAGAGKVARRSFLTLSHFEKSHLGPPIILLCTRRVRSMPADRLQLDSRVLVENPPFNDSDWRGELLKDDKRGVYGVPPAGNANYAWVQHFIHHLAPTGLAGFVLANGSMSSNQSGEGEIRKAIIEADLADCMVALPGQLFCSTQLPVCPWFLARNKRNGRFRDRCGETLFLDARKMGSMVDRTHRDPEGLHAYQPANAAQGERFSPSGALR